MNVSVLTELDESQVTDWPADVPVEEKPSSHIRTVEFELALGAEDLRANGFEACIESAAQSAGFHSLFNIPALPEHKWQRLAAVAAVEDGKPLFVFIALNDAGDHAEIQPDLSSTPHLQEFAEAYFELMLCQSAPLAPIAD